jgi:hypothetical protein
MAVVIRFNTLIVRKSSIVAKYSGGLTKYRQDVFPDELTYYEDHHLTVAFSMGGPWRYWDDFLQNCGLVYEHNGQFVDFTPANQLDGVDPRCDWLESAECCGFPVCWLIGTTPDYVVDFKPIRRSELRWINPFIEKISKTMCPNCSQELGLGAAVQAIDVEEYRTGPLGKIHENPNQNKSEFILFCAHCSHDALFDYRGWPVGEFRG